MVYRSLFPKYRGLFYFTIWIPCLLECFSKQAKMPLHFHSFFGLPLPAQLLHSHWLFYWEINMMALSAFLSSSMISSPQFTSVTHSVVSDSLWPNELQHARPPCPSPTPRVHPNPCPLTRWCHPTISSSVIPFSSCPQSFPASGSFLMSQLFASGGQSIAASASVP